MKNLSNFFLVLIFLILTNIIFAQNDPVKFGEISIDVLESNDFDADTSAEAIILCDFGYSESSEYQFTRILRIKILREEGYEWLNMVKYNTYDKTSVRGITYNLENGKIVRDELDKKSIKREDVYGDFDNLHITMPNVKKGSVVDIEFTSSGYPFEWNFQYDIPVLWSELRMRRTPHINLNISKFGMEPLFLDTPGHWIAKDMPAFKEEPYINSSSNYITRFEFEINDIYNVVSITSSWNAVNTILLEDKRFGDLTRACSFLNKHAKEIEEENKSDIEKLRAAHRFIQERIQWNDLERLFASTSYYKKIYEDRTGNSADINLMLLALLKKLDFEVYPVALSTRDNGMLSPVHPSFFKLNYVIAAVKLEDRYLFLDATEKYLPYYLLPERCFNWRGRIVDFDKSDWIDIPVNQKDKDLIFGDFSINEYFELVGVLKKSNYDYAAFNARNRFNSFNDEEEYIIDIQEENGGLRIKDYTFENADSIELPFKEIFTVEINNKLNVIDDEIYLFPVLFGQLDKNPFVLNERKYPISFPVLEDDTYLFKIKIPDDYEVYSMPESADLSLANRAATFNYTCQEMSNTVIVNCKLCINKSLFLVGEYPALKQFFDFIVEKQAQPIILKRIENNEN